MNFPGVTNALTTAAELELCYASVKNNKDAIDAAYLNVRNKLIRSIHTPCLSHADTRYLNFQK